ncbi:uncharacterized protein LOC117116707 [Anneissia japonica]|uniref:uncharacterized protein LOC117116707 n=1 Tax=Anneissia japonica TaxID=1529436 RepID=UPI001425724C|nr:uncharacterized protein LOC117116707 [Anneissia japonica]
MFTKVWLLFLVFPVILSNAQFNVPEIHALGCLSSTIQKYECSWELGPNGQDNEYQVTQKVLLQPPTVIKKSNIFVDGRTLLVKFRNKDYGSISKQRITLNATNRFGSSIYSSIEYYPKQQAIPLPPSGLHVNRKYHDYMDISWRKSKGVALYEDLLIYKLRYRDPTVVYWTEIRDLQRRKFELHNVDAFTEYELQVASKFVTYENQSAGWSPWSTKILTTTDMTYPGSPKNLKIHTTFTNLTSIHVTWLPPTQRNGPISKYYVRYKFTDTSWSSKLSVTSTWFDLNARCTTGQVYRLKIGIAAVNVSPDGREFIGTEEFVARSVCSQTNQYDEYEEDTVASLDDESSYKKIHTATVLIIILCVIGLCFMFILITVIFYKRSKLHGNPKIEWRFMHLEAPSPPQTETEIFDELPRRLNQSLQDTAVNDVLMLPHSSSALATSECISDSNDAIDQDKHSEGSCCDDSSDLKDPNENNERLTDQWPVAEDFSYVTNGF